MNLFRKELTKDHSIAAMVSGHTYPIESVDDKVFSSKLMGEGIAIEPKEGKIYAPASGKVLFANPEMPHSIGLKLETGVEVMIHIGINTVNLPKDIFDLKVSQNVHVKKGELLIQFDKKSILENDCSDIVMLIITKNYKHNPAHFRFFMNRDVIGGIDTIIEFDR